MLLTYQIPIVKNMCFFKTLLKSLWLNIRKLYHSQGSGTIVCSKSFNVYFIIAVVYGCLGIYGCKEGNIPVIYIDNLEKEEYYPVTVWLIKGPYGNADILQELNNAQISNCYSQQAAELFFNADDGPGIIYDTDVEYTDFKKISDKNDDSDAVFYSLALIRSPRKQNATIMSGNRRGMEIWLNEKNIFRMKRREVYNNYSHYLNYTNVRLKRGNNELFVKHYFSNEDDEWRSNIMITSEGYARDYYYRKSNFDLINPIFVQKDSALRIMNRYYHEGTEFTCKILVRYKETVISKRLNKAGPNRIRLPDFREGLYYCSVSFPDFSVCEPFFYGNADSALTYYTNIILSLKDKHPEGAIHLEALRLRLKHLIRFRAVPGQLTSYFDVDISDDGKEMIKMFSGESRATRTEDCVIPVNRKTRYIRFTGHMNAANSYNNIAEMIITGRDSIELSPGEISASGYYNNEIPENIFDKDYNTVWSQEGDGRWIETDLGEVKYIQDIGLAFRASVYDPELEVKLWERKIIILLNEAEKHLQKDERGSDLYHCSPGRHLRGYISKTDNDTLNYNIQVPDAVKAGKPLPLVIFIPIDMGTRSPFLMSMLAADILKDDKISIETERHNMMAAIVSGNNYESELMPGFYTELNSILSDINNDFPIDTTRIYLYGVCISAAKCLQYTANFPHKIAAISNVSAAFHDENYHNIENLSNIPLLFIHSREDEHTPISQLASYIDTASSKSLYPEIRLFRNSSHYAYSNSFVNLSFEFFEDKEIDYSPDEIRFFIKELKYNRVYWIRVDRIDYGGNPHLEAKVRNNSLRIETSDIYSLSLFTDSIPYDHSSPLKVILNGNNIYRDIPRDSIFSFQAEPDPEQSNNFQKSHLTEGPINHFFANRFIVVEGTMGNTLQCEESYELARYLKQLWKEYYYNDCLLKTDTSITDKDIKTSNLLLTGNNKTNSLIKKVEANLPLEFNEDGFIFRNKQYNQNNCIFIIYANPMNPEKYVLIAGGSELSRIKWFAKTSLFVEANDYIIFNPDSGEIVERGDFNSDWE